MVGLPGWLSGLPHWWQRRRLRQELRQAEIELGMQGWQAADFPSELDETLTFLRRVEEAQVDHLNHNAELAEAMRNLDEREKRARFLYDGECAAIQDRCGHALARQPEIADEVQTARERETSFRDAITDLDAELEALTRERSKIVRSKKNVENRLRQLTFRSTELRTEREALDRQRRQWGSRQVMLSKEAEAVAASCQQAEHDRRAAQRKLLNELRLISRARNECFRHRAGSESEFRRIEKMKADAFAILGATLANAGIAPPNQPELLQIVQELRQALPEEKGTALIARSLDSD